MEEQKRRRCLLRFGGCFSPVQESCRPSSKRTLLHSISLYLSAYLPPPLHPTPFCLQCHPTSLLPPLPSLCLCQPLLNQIDCRCVTSRREDSLRLCAREPSLWHSASSNLPCRNLSTEPKTYINSVYTCRALWSSDLS